MGRVRVWSEGHDEGEEPYCSSLAEAGVKASCRNVSSNQVGKPHSINAEIQRLNISPSCSSS